MWGTRAYYRREQPTLKYAFEYGVAERLGRRLARYFHATGKRFYRCRVARKKWESLAQHASETRALLDFRYGIITGLIGAGLIAPEDRWPVENVLYVGRLPHAIVVACLFDCRNTRRAAIELIHNYEHIDYIYHENSLRRP